MAIPTPSELAASQTKAWQEKAEGEREAMFQRVQKGVESAVNVALASKKLTPKGGVIEYRENLNLNYRCDGEEINEHQDEIEEIRHLLKQRGWASDYRPHSYDAGGHRDSSCWVTEHRFYLTPLTKQ